VPPVDNTLILVAFLMASSFVLLVALLVSGRKNRLQSRMRRLSEKPGRRDEPEGLAGIAQVALPRMGQALMPSDDERRTRLQTRLTHAGFYGRQAMSIFLGVKLLLIIGPAVVALMAALAGLLPFTEGLLIGCALGLVGLIGPSFWLDWRKAARQTDLRRALPDALDIIVICLEGGLSLPGAVRRVAAELRGAHPVLADELAIVQREVQLGLSTGEALRGMGDRADLEELRSLASIVSQSERFGASLVKSLRIHAEMLRQKRLQYAEEMAQKAATKVLFPTVLFILPAVFIVILAPAVIQILAIFESLQR
jgi:tight adherence protein C